MARINVSYAQAHGAMMLRSIRRRTPGGARVTPARKAAAAPSGSQSGGSGDSGPPHVCGFSRLPAAVSVVRTDRAGKCHGFCGSRPKSSAVRAFRQQSPVSRSMCAKVRASGVRRHENWQIQNLTAQKNHWVALASRFEVRCTPVMGEERRQLRHDEQRGLLPTAGDLLGREHHHSPLPVRLL